MGTDSQMGKEISKQEKDHIYKAIKEHNKILSMVNYE